MTSTLSPAMAEATLDLAPEAAREVFQKIAALWDCPAQIKGERLRLSFPRGAIDLQTAGAKLRVLLRWCHLRQQDERLKRSAWPVWQCAG